MKVGDKAIEATVVLLVFALVALPIGLDTYYTEAGNLSSAVPDSITLITDNLPILLFAMVVIGALRRMK